MTTKYILYGYICPQTIFPQRLVPVLEEIDTHCFVAFYLKGNPNFVKIFDIDDVVKIEFDHNDTFSVFDCFINGLFAVKVNDIRIFDLEKEAEFYCDLLQSSDLSDSLATVRYSLAKNTNNIILIAEELHRAYWCLMEISVDFAEGWLSREKSFLLSLFPTSVPVRDLEERLLAFKNSDVNIVEDQQSENYGRLPLQIRNLRKIQVLKYGDSEIKRESIERGNRSKVRGSISKSKSSKPLMPLPQAVDVLKQFSGRKFDQTVEIHINLGIDPAQSDQIVRGSLVLPHGIGKRQRVIVFAKGDLAKEAEQAGADAVGSEQLFKKIKEGWLDFDVCIATPDMMGLVGPLGKLLGPRGLMPSPRAGTVTNDVSRVVKEYKTGKVEFRNDKGANVHAVVGKMSFDASKLVDNIGAFISYVQSIKPNSVRGSFIKSIAICATMTPSVRVENPYSVVRRDYSSSINFMKRRNP
jgi:large subunit ribosomal protein L1